MEPSKKFYEIVKEHAQSLGMDNRFDWNQIGVYTDSSVDSVKVEENEVGYRIIAPEDAETEELERAIEDVWGKSAGK